MKEIIAFLDQLMRNNNREWFNAHKSEYQYHQSHFNDFALKLIDGIAEFDSDVYGLELKDCTYRIYRDIRFSPDKRPYKNHMGCYVCKGGKKSWKAGYYFHIEAHEGDYIGSNLLATGMYIVPRENLLAIRDVIANNGDEFADALKKAGNFSFSESSYLKRVPNGFPKDSPYADYLRLKDYSLSMPLPDDILFGSEDELLNFVLKQFKTSKDFNQLLNKIVEP